MELRGATPLLRKQPNPKEIPEDDSREIAQAWEDSDPMAGPAQLDSFQVATILHRWSVHNEESDAGEMGGPLELPGRARRSGYGKSPGRSGESQPLARRRSRRSSRP